MGTNRYAEQKRGSTSITNVDTDGSGQFTATIGDLKRIEGEEDVYAEASGGYVINALSVSGNTVTCEVRVSSGTGGNEMQLVTSGTDVTDVTVTAFGE